MSSKSLLVVEKRLDIRTKMLYITMSLNRAISMRKLDLTYSQIESQAKPAVQ